MNRFDNFN